MMKMMLDGGDVLLSSILQAVAGPKRTDRIILFLFVRFIFNRVSSLYRINLVHLIQGWDVPTLVSQCPQK